MKYIIFFLLSLSALQAQNSLKGKVYDKEMNEPLIGASISIPELKTGAISDIHGDYVFKTIPKGKYLVISKYINYKPLVNTVEIDGITQQDFEMNQSIIQTNEIIVTGLSEATELNSSPLSLSIINSEYLKTNSSTNAIDAISKVPGVNAVTTGPNISKPFIRGLGYNRILTLFDNSRQEGQQWGDEHGIEVDQYSVDNVEVIKGPSSLIYGSDALAGVINLIPTKLAPEGKFIGDIITEYQTNNGLIGMSGMLSQTKDGFGWGYRLSHKSATNYQNKIDGRVFGTAFSETDANGSASIVKDWGISNLHFSIFNNLQEVPDGSRDSLTRKFTKQVNEADTLRVIVPDNELNSYSIKNLHQQIEHYRICSDNTFYFKESHIDITLSYQRSVRREFNHPEYATVPGLYLKLNTFIYNLNYSYPKLWDWKVSAGVNGMYQSNNVTSGTDFVIPSYNQFDIGTFFTINRTFDNFNFSAGARFDLRNFTNYQLYTRTNPANGLDIAILGNDTNGAKKVFSDYNRLFNGFTGSAGVTYNLNDNLSFKFNISRGFRAPNIAEISANGVHPGTNIYQLGNPDFKPEFSFQQDFEIIYSSKFLNCSISIFNNNIDNYIFNQKLFSYLNKDSIIVNGNQTFQFMQSSARLFGGEASIEINPSDELQLMGNISFVNGENKGGSGITINDSSKYLPSIPPIHGIVEVRYNFDFKTGNFRNIFIKSNIEYNLSQNRVLLAYETETPTKGYILLNFGFGFSWVNSAGTTILNGYLFVNNILDETYQNHLSRLKYFEPYPGNPSGHNGIYGMGRNINLKINIPIN